MATLLIEMPCGVAGDMFLAALVDLGGDLAQVEHDLLALGLGAIRIGQQRVSVNGISALRVDVAADQDARWTTGDPGDQGHHAAHHARHADEARPGHGQGDGHSHGHSHSHSHSHGHSHAHGHDHDHDHDHPHGHGHSHPLAPPLTAAAGASHDAAVPHLSLSHHAPHRPYRIIRELLDAASLPARVKQRAQAVFLVLAEAEGQVHGVSAEEVEFHEVGAVDAIADVVGCCLLLEQLGVTRIISTPLLPGTGTVLCAHGRMPVPVPAVAAMLARRHAPWTQLADETGELTTPTGCALVTTLTDAYLHPGTAQTVTTRRVGYGAGHRRIAGMTNAVRLSLIEELEDTPPRASDQIVEISCTIDDATGEQLAIVLEDVLAAGAKDAYLTAVHMKKGRPGQLLTVLADPGDRERLAALILSRSPSIGVRHRLLERTVLPRRAEQVVVDGQTIAIKVVTMPGGQERAKPEAESVRAAAAILGRDFASLQQAAVAAYLARAATGA